MPVSLILHREEFSNQYERFWNNPYRAPIRWIAVLFGILFVSAFQASIIAGVTITLDEATLQEYQNLVLTSQERIIQCLRLGNYMKGGSHTIEALLFLLQLEYLQGEDKQHECWQLIGVTVRIALKMGYHRDGSHFPHLSAYEAEMRRRIWYILIQFDIATAAQVGLPRMIRETQYDTLPPHNLLDTDFNSTSPTLPPSRPESEPTLPQFLTSKSKIISVYGMICDFTNSSQQHDYTEAMRLDALLNTAFSQKPMHLAPKPISRSITDGTALIVRRLYIAMSFHHAQISLHRKYMLRAKSDPRYAYSHATCIAAASTALQYQNELEEYSQPGRMLQGERYKILSLVQSEFLLATTVLCANLNDDLDHKRWETTALCKREEVEKLTRVLAKSRRVWEGQLEFSKEARVAAKAATVVLAKAVAMGLMDPMPGTAASTHYESNVPLTGGAGGTASELSADMVHQTGSFDYEVSLDAHTGFDDEMWSSVLDMEQSWDAWIQR
ncbi:hypothetical protein E8E13_006049 [Curvularia kusanoi]|uniref:Xylanolytic transcriptional activator regulatory domain-containing protein n=1 Tax=Curvularia kusanoi TaxID=90978 RepID=A0A9P4W7S9_CURKU|nr:hypothetical protein E8E13_006049 [Curvularia kusanoi]